MIPPEMMRWRLFQRLRGRELNVLSGKCGLQLGATANQLGEQFCALRRMSPWLYLRDQSLANVRASFCCWRKRGASTQLRIIAAWRFADATLRVLSLKKERRLLLHEEQEGAGRGGRATGEGSAPVRSLR